MQNDPNQTTRPDQDPKFADKDNTHSVLTDKKATDEQPADDSRPVKNADQEGFGLDDGPNQPLSKEMLTDLQDAGQRDLQRQREEEKQRKA